MIINDRDNDKTVDDQTGVYLQLLDIHGPSSGFKFAVHDGDYALCIRARRTDTAIGSTLLIEYFVQTITEKGERRSRNYQSILISLMGAFKDRYGYNRKHFSDAAVSVKFNKKCTEFLNRRFLN